MRPVRVSNEDALGTLGAGIAVTASMTGAANTPYRCKSVTASWVITGSTAAEGPVTVGYAHSDYTQTEIKECLEAFASVDQGDKIARERTSRLVRIVGTISLGSGANRLNNGMPVKTKLNWLINIGDSVNIFSFNENTSTALTTGAIVNHQGTIWIQDVT